MISLVLIFIADFFLSFLFFQGQGATPSSSSSDECALQSVHM